MQNYKAMVHDLGHVRAEKNKLEDMDHGILQTVTSLNRREIFQTREKEGTFGEEIYH